LEKKKIIRRKVFLSFDLKNKQEKELYEILKRINKFDRTERIMNIYKVYKEKEKQACREEFSNLEKELFGLLKIHAGKNITIIGSSLGGEIPVIQRPKEQVEVFKEEKENNFKIKSIETGKIENKNGDLDYDAILDQQISQGVE